LGAGVLEYRMERISGIGRKGTGIKNIMKQRFKMERSQGKGENEFGYRAIRNPGVGWKGAVEKTGRDLENTCQAAVRLREGLRLMDEC
jgi:hypothetical protein